MRDLLASSSSWRDVGLHLSQDEEMRPRPAHPRTATPPVAPHRPCPPASRCPTSRWLRHRPDARSWRAAARSTWAGPGRPQPTARGRLGRLDGGVYFLDGRRLWLTDLSRCGTPAWAA